MNNLLTLDNMLTPKIVTVIYWIGIIKLTKITNDAKRFF